MFDIQLVFPVLGILGLLLAVLIYRTILSHPAGTDEMKSIASEIELGAMAFLKSEYSKLSIFVLAATVLLFFSFGWQTSVSFIFRGFMLRVSRFYRYESGHQK